MLTTIYAEKILGGHPSPVFAANVLNGPVDIWNQVCTAINGWCSNEAVYRAWDAMGRPDTEDFMPSDYDSFTNPEWRRAAIAEARISAIAQIIQDQLYELIIDRILSGGFKIVDSRLVEGPEDPHGPTWVEGGIRTISELDCYIMEGDE
jgi:hypothetical protein|nr:MAG TPA: hypothetical protein [Caudoviricetes sp.]